MSVSVDRVRTPSLSCAHVLLARAHHAAHAVLMKLAVGRTHVSHSHVRLSVPPTQCVRPTHLPCMPAMHLLATNKSRHAFPLKAWFVSRPVPACTRVLSEFTRVLHLV
ncbi:hypothetical protein PanWU01x14_175420 [Parasponia andersonii]|uniref:Uncharacterized protein n=1 Tax=Parasponia andersonii TaxID=3476 RepID=A0A2P5C8A7_PARAD|nr:hypothetical protein PanWU01x14_175420 [Parasponia andersonii]